VDGYRVKQKALVMVLTVVTRAGNRHCRVDLSKDQEGKSVSAVWARWRFINTPKHDDEDW